MRSTAFALSALVVAAMSAQAQDPIPGNAQATVNGGSAGCPTTATTSTCAYPNGASNAAFTAAPAPAGNATASASFNGVNTDKAFLASDATAYYYENVTINQLYNPTSDIYYIVLRSADNVSASTDEPALTGAEASAYLEAGAQDFSYAESDLNDQATGDASPDPSSSRPLEVTLETSQLANPDYFYYEIQSYAQVFDKSPATNLNASAFVSAPVITLEDENGNDITTNYTLTYDPVTTTPEPASLSLMATGLVGLGGLVRRRKKPAA